MSAIAILYAADLSPVAFEPLRGGKDSFSLAVEKARSFPDVSAVALLVGEDFAFPANFDAAVREGILLERSASWNRKKALERIAALADPYDLAYFAWADCPLLDAELASAIRARHLRYAAEYSYADGWPYGFAPELLAPRAASSLAFLAAEDAEPVGRDLIFSVLQKDINSFDIETEISPVDLRSHRLSLSADSARNLLLLKRFMDAGVCCAADAADAIAKNPAFLRTLPAFFCVQVAGACPQECGLCPWPRVSRESSGLGPLERSDFMPLPRFEALLDSIRAFSRDAVIDLSAWGECSLHPEIEKMIRAVMDRPELALIIETSGIGWKSGILESIAAASALSPSRTSGRAKLSWIVSLDSDDSGRYAVVRGRGYEEARTFAEKAIAAFPKDAWVQAVRVKDQEEDLERFYRAWKVKTPNVIVQKHDDFCGYLPSMKATDLSPVIRSPCWHLMRDVVVLMDGTVPICKEDLGRSPSLGNAFTDDLSLIWERGADLYASHASLVYPGICAKCDEYYTYNF